MASPPVQIIFPYSGRPQARQLVLRNNGKAGLIVNVTESSAALLELEIHSFFISPGRSRSLSVRLHPNALPDVLDNDGLKEHYLLIHCKLPKFNQRQSLEQNLDSFRRWIFSNRKPSCDLVARLSIIRSKSFCPLDTLIDLPGKAHFIGPVINPTFEYDDRDCMTVHRIDSDTDTVVALSNNEIMQSLKTNSVTSTAHPFDFGTSTVGFSNDTFFSWLTTLLRLIFPTPATPLNPPSLPKPLSSSSAAGTKCSTAEAFQTTPP